MNKCEETWDYLEEFDLIGLTETWVEEETWKKIRNKLSNKYKWNSIPARRENKKGRAKGGIITAINKELQGIKVKEINKGAMEVNFEYNGNRWRVVTVYSQDIERTMETLAEEIEEEEEACIMIGGDFNARTGSEGGPMGSGGRGEEGMRRSRDKVINREGRIMLNRLRDRGWVILNGSGEREGGWTYVGGMGSSVIDYVLTDVGAMEEVKRVEEGTRTESDHMPLEVEMEGEGWEGEGRRTDTQEVERSVWTKEGVEQYHERCKDWTCEKTESQEIWREIEEKVKGTITKVKKKITPWKLGRREWHSKQWREKKRELRGELRRLKSGKTSREEYITKRKEYRAWCDEERKKHEREEEEKISAIRTEEEAWRYINKYRKKRERVDENIELESWTAHFMDLLEGTKEKTVMEMEEDGEEGGREGDGEEEEELTREEIIKQLRELKKGKAPGENGIENEAWRLMSREIGEAFVILLNKVWKGEKIPEEWNRGLISPIFKKGEKSEVKNYRGVTLMDTAYKVYANVLNERLKKEIEEKMEEGQFGFRAGRGTGDAIYTLNHVINRELAKKRGKVYVFFADLKAAFDKVNREELGKMLRKLKIGKRLRKRIMETYRETKNIVKVGKRKSEEFWTKSGVRQGCPMSPALFNVYVSDLEAEMRKEQTGGMVVGRKKFWTIAYADDIVLLARSEQELRGMIKRFKRYLEKKGLCLSPEKSKVVVFEKGRKGGSRREWKWGDENIEEVKEMKYLGYVMQKNGGSEKHIEERMRRAIIAMKQIWSIGERLFKDDFGRRMKMFDSIVGSIALYGAEVWGWRNDERLDKVKKKYVKWILGLDRRTPNYILIEETKMRELRLEALKRAIKYEETARKSKKEIVRECIRETDREGGDNGMNKWRRGREEVLERLELTKEGLKERREREEPKRITQEIMKGIERIEKEERRKKIGESRYNEYYRNITTEGVPKYLQGRKKKKARNLIARYRCGNEMRGSQYWKEEKDKKCRMCKEEEENIRHVLGECEGTRIEMRVEEFLSEDGGGYEAMRRVDRIREEKSRAEGRGERGEGECGARETVPLDNF